MQEYIPFIAQILEEYGYVIVFFGAMIAGTAFVLVASFLASLHIFNIYIVFVVALLGVLLSDSFWYYMGFKFKAPISRYGRRLLSLNNAKKADRFLLTFNDHFKKVLLWGKLVYGMRILSLLACGHQRIKYRQFFYYNLLGSIVWLLVTISVGYLLGFSWSALSHYRSYVKYLVIFGLLVYLIIRLVLSRLINFFQYESRS